jgi:hypothetical protein
MTTRHKAPSRRAKAAKLTGLAALPPQETGAQVRYYDSIIGGQNTTGKGNPDAPKKAKKAKATTKPIAHPFTYSGKNETFVWVSAGPGLPNTWYYVPISEAGMYTSQGGVVAGRSSGRQKSSHSSSTHKPKKTHISIPNPGSSSHISQHAAPPHLTIPAPTRSPHP